MLSTLPNGKCLKNVTPCTSKKLSNTERVGLSCVGTCNKIREASLAYIVCIRMI
jgi:hypothetical protein